jgi:site-specific DNA recombinase
MPKVYGYIRVSTREQEISGLSVEAQLEKIRAYCIANDLDLVGVVQETGSGKNLKREGLASLLIKARAGYLDGIVCLKIDRMFRSTIDALTVTAEMDRLGVAVHFIQEYINTKTPAGKVFFTLIAAFAQMERELISERTTAALAAKRARGERMGREPYGWALAGPGSQDMVPVTDEQENAAHILQMGRDRKPAVEIAESLNRMGRVNRAGRPWNKSAVNRVLRNSRKGSRHGD